MSDRVIAAKRPEKKGLWYGDLLAFFWSCSFVIKCRQIKKEFNQKRQVKKTSDIWGPSWVDARVGFCIVGSFRNAGGVEQVVERRFQVQAGRRETTRV